MSVRRNSNEDERCYGSCFACIPTCPRHPENQEKRREEESAALTAQRKHEEEESEEAERDQHR